MFARTFFGVVCESCLFQGGPSSVTVCAWDGPSSGFSVPTALFWKGFFSFVTVLTEREGSGFGSWVPKVPVPLSVSGKMVPTVPVNGSDSVFLLSCFFWFCRNRGNLSGGLANGSFAQKVPIRAKRPLSGRSPISGCRLETLSQGVFLACQNVVGVQVSGVWNDQCPSPKEMFQRPRLAGNP